MMFILALMLLTTTPYQSFPELRGPWLGQAPPRDQPVVFAEGILKPPSGFHSSVVFSPDGNEAYWTAMASGESFRSRCVAGAWTVPLRLSLDPDFGVREPMLAHGGARLYYLSRRPLDDDPVNRERIWFVERDGVGWSNPRAIDAAVRAHPTHWQFSFNSSDDLYFASEVEAAHGESDIYVAEWRGDDKYGEPANIGAAVNTDAREFCPFIAPDDSYLIFSRSTPNRRSDLFISFRGEAGEWQEALNMGDVVNSEHNETCPVVTPDGQYLFFLRMSQDINDVFWMSTSVIAELRE